MSLLGAFNASNQQAVSVKESSKIVNEFTGLKEQYEKDFKELVDLINRNYIEDIKSSYNEFEHEVITENSDVLKIKLGNGNFYFTFTKQNIAEDDKTIVSKKLDMVLGSKKGAYFINAKPLFTTDNALHSIKNIDLKLKGIDINTIPRSLLEEVVSETKLVLENIELLKCYGRNYYYVLNEGYKVLGANGNQGIVLKDILNHLTTQHGV